MQVKKTQIRLGRVLVVQKITEIIRLGLVLVRDFNDWFIARALRNFERPQLDVGLHNWVRELPADQPLRVENGVLLFFSSTVLQPNSSY